MKDKTYANEATMQMKNNIFVTVFVISESSDSELMAV